MLPTVKSLPNSLSIYILILSPENKTLSSFASYRSKIMMTLLFSDRWESSRMSTRMSMVSGIPRKHAHFSYLLASLQACQL
jgi:hypothetical protein